MTTLNQTKAFSILTRSSQVQLLRAATHGRVNLTKATRMDLDRGFNTESWIMVPTKRGLKQVAFNSTRAYSL